jgi:bifunctional N-acetylglucosamine-1-phosphate-uridyltransferase/glucosamine-1-phosphate-acetyltransferase GlmU-like protein
MRQWHVESKGSSGTGTVTCNYRGAMKTTTANFNVD